MRTLRVAGLGALCVMTAVGTAWAQDGGRIGLTIGYPADVGVICRLSDWLSIRPEISLSRTSLSQDGALAGVAIDSHVTTTQLRPAVSLLVHLRRWDNVQTYLVPSIEWDHTGMSSSLPAPTTGVTSATTLSGSGGLGVQFVPARHFGAFGEVGISYSHSKTSLLGVASTTSSLGTRAGVGVILFF